MSSFMLPAEGLQMKNCNFTNITNIVLFTGAFFQWCP